MEVIASKRFLKELRKCPSNIQVQIKNFITIAETEVNIENMPDMKKMSGYKDYYRVRVGSWRIGIKLESGIVQLLYLLTVQPRGDVYKTFPPK